MKQENQSEQNKDQSLLAREWYEFALVYGFDDAGMMMKLKYGPDWDDFLKFDNDTGSRLAEAEKILAGFKAPEGYDWDDWIDTMKHAKVVPVEPVNPPRVRKLSDAEIERLKAGEEAWMDIPDSTQVVYEMNLSDVIDQYGHLLSPEELENVKKLVNVPEERDDVVQGDNEVGEKSSREEEETQGDSR